MKIMTLCIIRKINFVRGTWVSAFGMVLIQITILVGFFIVRFYVRICFWFNLHIFRDRWSSPSPFEICKFIRIKISSNGWTPHFHLIFHKIFELALIQWQIESYIRIVGIFDRNRIFRPFDPYKFIIYN